jgi:hypothetical protein
VVNPNAANAGTAATNNNASTVALGGSISVVWLLLASILLMLRCIVVRQTTITKHSNIIS